MGDRNLGMAVRLCPPNSARPYMTYAGPSLAVSTPVPPAPMLALDEVCAYALHLACVSNMTLGFLLGVEAILVP